MENTVMFLPVLSLVVTMHRTVYSTTTVQYTCVATNSAFATLNG